MLKFLLFPLIIFTSSCLFSPDKTSPVVYFSNASEKPITNIRAVWADNVLTLNNLGPGDSRSQSFHIGGNDDFFGLVTFSWDNAAGKSIFRELFFKKNNLPSINDDEIYSYVQVYLEQNDLELMSSDAADLGRKTKRRDDLLAAYKQKYLNNTPMNIPSALIRVQPAKDYTQAGWVSRSY